MTEQLRVTHVVFDLDGGGMESLVAAITTQLRDSPVRCSVITLSGREGRIGSALRPNLERLVVLSPARGLSMLLPLGLIRALRQLRPDVVHLHSGAWYKGALAARLAGVRFVVFTEHGRMHDDPWMARMLDRAAALLTDVVVPVSNRLADYMERELGIPRRKLTVIENGVDTDALAPGAAPEAARAGLGIAPGSLAIGSVGRLERVKGFDRLLETMAALQQRQPELPGWTLVLCGDGSERSNLEAQAAALGIADRVRFPGWTTISADIYRSFALFAVTSRSEGLSLSLLEAMACGVPPVVNDVGANRQVLGDALAEYCVAAEDWDSFAALVAGLLRDPARRTTAGARAAARVRERFGLSRVVREYREVYERSRRRTSAVVSNQPGGVHSP